MAHENGKEDTNDSEEMNDSEDVTELEGVEKEDFEDEDSDESDYLFKKKKSSPFKIAILALFTVAVFFALLFTFLNFSFIVKEDLVLDVSPSAISVNTVNTGAFKADITVKSQHFLLCESECSYELSDLSGNATIDSGVKIVGKQQSFSKNYEIALNKRGEGQAIYIFNVKCRNFESVLCRTTGQEHVKSTIITVNYALSEGEKSDKEALLSSLSNISTSISKYLSERESACANLDNLSVLVPEKLSELSILKQECRNGSYFTAINSSISTLERMWKEEDYSPAYSFFLSGVQDEYLKFKDSSISISENTTVLYLSYNSVLQKIFFLVNFSNNELSAICSYGLNYNISEILQSCISLPGDINYAYLLFSNKGNQGYSSMAFMEELSGNLIIEAEALRQLYYSEIDRSYLEAFSLSYIGNSALVNFGLPGILGVGQNFSLLQENASPEMLSRECSNIIAVNSSVFLHNADASLKLKSNYSSLENSSSFAQARSSENANALYFGGQELSSALESANLSSERASYALSVINALPNSSLYVNASIFNITDSDILSVSEIVLPESFYEKLESCLRNSDYPIAKIENPGFGVFIPKAINETFSFALENNSATCCVFGKCTECCAGQCAGKKYPVIFIHGHLVFSKNSPETVLNAFSAMQDDFKEIGYIPAGLLNIEENISYGDWGKMASPVTVRATYYYITYYNVGIQTFEARKTDSIENYAIRLKEIVDEVKRRTGSDKVVIIAHSMGGLVAREYMLLFGEESVDKMVTIGTPNTGIEGALIKLCPVFGSQKECEDMTKDSVFLKRLNNPDNNPKNVRMYTISAVGCNTYGKPGDGVVVADNVVLDFAKNYRIEGRCTDLVQSDLHGRMIQPEIYPQTLKILKEIIADNSTEPFSPELIKR